MPVTLHLRISGRVQGVGYRDSLRGEALARGVSGWVRNRRDGTVEAVIQGEPAAVEAVLAWARRGPPMASVESAQASPAAGENARAYSGFEWRSTA